MFSSTAVYPSESELGTRPRILVIDDETSSRCFLLSVLEESQYTVEAAENGKIAWDSLTERQQDQLPDLIICDWIMPDLTGIELCRRIKYSPDF